MSDRKKILWLVSWYPNKYDPFDGDFIQRHARAASLFDNIHVLFIKQSYQQNDIEKVWSGANGLTEQIIYLPKQDGLLGKLKNYFQWRAHYEAQVNLIITREKPDLIHVHVPWKVGLVAIWAKKKFGMPFFVTEHWGIYNRVVADNIHTKSVLFRSLLRRIYRYADRFLSVSQYLGEGVRETIYAKDYSIVPNVVDTSLFHPSLEKHRRFTFIHVSNMVPLKNVGGIINAFYLFLKNTNADAQLILVGSPNDEHISLSQELGLYDQSVFFRGEVAYEDVASEMRKAHVFVLNSDMENSPCVIGEGLCCGLPVIATEVGGVPELVDEKTCILVKPRSNEALSDAFQLMYQRYRTTAYNEVANFAHQKFSYQSVGKLFYNAYRNN